MFITFGPVGSMGLGYFENFYLVKSVDYSTATQDRDKICTILESLEY